MRLYSLHAYLSYSGKNNFSNIFLQNLANHLHELQNVGSTKTVISKPGHRPSWPGQRFFRKKTLPRSVGWTWARQSEHTLALVSALGPEDEKSKNI